MPHRAQCLVLAIGKVQIYSHGDSRNLIKPWHGGHLENVFERGSEKRVLKALQLLLRNRHLKNA